MSLWNTRTKTLVGNADVKAIHSSRGTLKISSAPPVSALTMAKQGQTGSQVPKGSVHQSCQSGCAVMPSFESKRVASTCIR
jgi:hypothetical protein